MTTPLPPGALWQRALTLTVGTLAITYVKGIGLDVEFTVRRGVQVTQKAVKPVPNTCDLKIYNLSVAHRKQLEQLTTVTTPQSANPQSGAQKIVPCIISAGYVGRQSIVFSGELRAAQSVTEGADTITELTTGDGDTALQQTRLTVALPPGSTLGSGLRKVLAALGIGQGNLSRALALISANPLVAQMYSKGVVFKGSPAEILTDICRAAGLQWSIQHGVVQFQDLGQPLGGQAILIDAAHGMVGSPSVDTKGILTFTTLMLPDLAPGVKVAMNAKNVKGGYQVLSVETTGQTNANEWYQKVEAQRY